MEKAFVRPTPGDGAGDTTTGSTVGTSNLRSNEISTTNSPGQYPFDKSVSNIKNPRVFSASGSGTGYPSSPTESAYSANSASDDNLDLKSTESVRRIFQDESTVVGGRGRGDAHRRAPALPSIMLQDSSNPHSAARRISVASLRALDTLESRLRIVDVREEDDPCLYPTRRLFDTPPRLLRKYFTPPDGRIIPSQLEPPSESQDPEYVHMQKKYSRVLLLLCCLFPPMLIILAFGGMDETIGSFTDGRVDEVGIFYKRVAFTLGTVVGTVCCSAPIVVGILAAKGLL